jgi:putative DNA methylase
MATSPTPTSQTMLDAGTLPVEHLAELARREGRRPNPVYGAHRWFARRFASAFRALLTAAQLPPDADFWGPYAKGVSWHGRTILDPFVGGGTAVVEALQLGANVVGVDVDAVACAVTRFEVRAAEMGDLRDCLATLKARVGSRLANYYQTMTPAGEARDVLHYFWVQVLDCRSCGHVIEAHPHYQLAYEAESNAQWAFCPSCYAVSKLCRTQKHLHCRPCARRVTIGQGTVHYGRVTCPQCSARERLIDVAERTGSPPAWRLFALETVERVPGSRSVPLNKRHFQAATAHDHAAFAAAECALLGRADGQGHIPWVPDRRIPVEGRADDRLPRYGYVRYRELFNPRQLLHLSLLAEEIASLDSAVREPIALAFSDHLATNCMMTHYAFGWRRLAPLFSLRAFHHVTRPVEINPWMDGTGRGTFPNAVRQVERAIAAAKAVTPSARTAAGASQIQTGAPQRSSRVIHGTAWDLHDVADATVDLVLTDPPYYDNIAYSELSDFFLPWHQMLGLVPDGSDVTRGLRDGLTGRGRDLASAHAFSEVLGRCFQEMTRVLSVDGRVVFTYQHGTALAWHALATALAAASLRPIQVFPLLGNGDGGPHIHEGTIAWDAVIVAVRDTGPRVAGPITLSLAQKGCAAAHFRNWATRLSSSELSNFRTADRRNFFRACLVAAALGLYSRRLDGDPVEPLFLALDADPPTLFDIRSNNDVRYVVYCDFSEDDAFAESYQNARRVLESAGAEVITDIEEATNVMESAVMQSDRS